MQIVKRGTVVIPFIYVRLLVDAPLRATHEEVHTGFSLPSAVLT